MRKLFICFGLLLIFSGVAFGVDLEDAFGMEAVEEALPENAKGYMAGISIDDTGDLGDGISAIVCGALGDSGGAMKRAVGLGVQIVAIVLLASVMGFVGDGKTVQASGLAAVLAIGMCCISRISGYFTEVAETVDSISAFSGFLFSALAASTAATGAVGTSTALYGVTVAVCSLISRGMQLLFLPGISCYMALMLASSAVGDNSLSMVADTIKQLLTLVLKFAVIGFTAYLSLTGVVSGSADSASIRAAKLTISTAVPVVGSLIADASETLLVSAGLLRSGIGIFGMLGVLAVSIGPFLETGVGYLVLKCTAAVSASTGEKQLSGFISALASGFGLLTALVGVCTLLIIIACVCFMRVSVG